MRRYRAPFPIVAAMLAAALAAGSALADGETGIPAVIADFDNLDSAGEAPDSTAAHAARVAGFAGLLRDNLAAQGRYEVLALSCPEAACTAGGMAPDDLVQAARASGARVLVYGGIHKMSTLVHWGKIQAVDLESDRLLLDRSFSFRGDTDEAFQRAAEFIVRYLDEVAPEP